MTMSVPSMPRRPGNRAASIPPEMLPGVPKVTRIKKAGTRIEREVVDRSKERLSISDEDEAEGRVIFRPDQAAKLKVADIHAALEAVGVDPVEKERVSAACETAARDKQIAHTRLTKRMEQLGLGQDQLTQYLQNPAAIGSWNRAKEWFRKKADRFVDGSYQTMDELVANYQRAERVAAEAQAKFRVVMEDHTPQRKQARAEATRSDMAAAQHEKEQLSQLINNESAAIEKLLIQAESKEREVSELIRFGGLAHQAVLKSSLQLGAFAAEHPNALRSAEWRGMQDKIHLLELWVDRARVAGQREVEKTCLIAKEERVAGSSYAKKAVEGREAATAQLWAQEALHETVEGRTNRSFIEYVDKKLTPTDPMLQSVLKVYTLVENPLEAEQLVRHNPTYSLLRDEQRVLVDRYIHARSARSKQIADRYAYHTEHAWQKQNLAWIAQGVTHVSSARQKELDLEEVQIHGHLARAYPKGRMASEGRELLAATEQAARMLESLPRVEQRLLEVEKRTEALTSDSLKPELKAVLAMHHQALAGYVNVTAGVPNRLKSLAVDVQAEIPLLATRIQHVTEREEREGFNAIRSRAETWADSQGPVLKNLVTTAEAEAIKTRLIEVGRDAFKQEMYAFRSNEPMDVWKENAWRKIEDALNAVLSAAVSEGFEKKYVVAAGGKMDAAKLSEQEASRLMVSLRAASAAERVSYLQTLAQYFTLYGAWMKSMLQPNQKEVFVEMEKQLREANEALGLHALTHVRPAFWEDPRRYAVPKAPVAEAAFTPAIAKEEFMKVFDPISRTTSPEVEKIGETLFTELEKTLGFEAAAQLAVGDKKVLLRMVRMVLHPDSRLRYASDTALLQTDVNKELSKLSFAAQLDEATRERIYLTIDSEI